MQAREHLRYLSVIFKHFRNPVLICLMRLGLVKVEYFVYQFQVSDSRYKLLARPASASGGDLSILREVLIDATYGRVLNILPSGPIRLVDIGANVGAFTIWLSRQHSIEEAHCFEPDPESFNL